MGFWVFVVDMAGWLTGGWMDGWMDGWISTRSQNNDTPRRDMIHNSDPSLADGRFLLALIAAIEPRAVDWDLVTSGMWVGCYYGRWRRIWAQTKPLLFVIIPTGHTHTTDQHTKSNTIHKTPPKNKKGRTSWTGWGTGSTPSRSRAAWAPASLWRQRISWRYVIVFSVVGISIVFTCL